MKYFGIGLILLAFVTILSGVVVWVWHGSGSTPSPSQSGTLPITGNQVTGSGTENASTTVSTNTLSLAATSGTVVVAQNFLKDSATVADPSNPGYYYLGYHMSTGPLDTSASEAPPYVIEYIASTNYFNIALLQEPIGEARHEAEHYLLAHLGITQNQACTLKYMVSVPDKVNSFYSGQSLGFSFCADAVLLP